MTLTYIRWRDACQEEASHPRTPVTDSPLMELHEVGFLIGDTAEAVSIAMELELDGSPSRWRLHIPRVNIIERRDMELDKAFPVRKQKKRKADGEAKPESRNKV